MFACQAAAAGTRRHTETRHEKHFVLAQRCHDPELHLGIKRHSKVGLDESAGGFIYFSQAALNLQEALKYLK